MPVEDELARQSPEKEMLLTIGVFDGVHRGHQFLISELLKKARESNFSSGIITLSRPPEERMCVCGRIAALQPQALPVLVPRIVGAPLAQPVLQAHLADQVEVILRVGVDALDTHQQRARPVVRTRPTAFVLLPQAAVPDGAVGGASALPARRPAFQSGDAVEDIYESGICFEDFDPGGLQIGVLLKLDLRQPFLQISHGCKQLPV